MATQGTNIITLADHARMLNPAGGIDSMIVDAITKRNDILQDLPFKEGNLITGEQTTIKTSMRSSAWRRLNEGYASGKMTTRQVTDTCGMLGNFTEVDKDVAELNGNTKAFRFEQAKDDLESIGQEFVDTLLYGNTDTDPEEIKGIACRYDDASDDQVIVGGGSGTDNTSIYLLTFGEKSMYGIYPKGSRMGIQTKDLGLQTLTDDNGKKYLGYQTHNQWKTGFCVKDERYGVRIPNIAVGSLKNDAATGADLIDLMIQAIHQNWDIGAGKTAFYCNRTVLSFLDRQTLNQSQMNVTYSTDPHGKRVINFRGIPVKRVDSILDAEDLVS